jgi:hypothetical protein
VGHLEHTGKRDPRSPRRPRQGRCRAWLRHRVRLRVVEAGRRAARRRRGHHAGAARNRAEAQREVRTRPRARRGKCRGDRATRRVVRSRDLRIRRLDLVRSVQMDPRGRKAPTAGGRARVPSQLHALGPLHAGSRQSPGVSAAPAARHEPHGLARRSRDRLPARHGDLIRLLRTSGFEILDMVEIFAPADAVNHPFYGEYMSVEWAQKWPSEEMWRARKRS